jgi:uncharacterized protein (DUF433 family)
MNPVITETIPVKKDKDGVMRVGETRVTLETVISAFKDGETAEDIALAYPTLSLADVYSVIGYYLHKKEDVEEYLLQQEEKSAAVRAENESRFNQTGIRQRLLARQK